MAKQYDEIRAKIIARAWKDEVFRKKFIKNPEEVFKEYGIDFPENVEMKVVSEDPTHFYFVLPQSPANPHEIHEAELEKLAAGGGDCQKGCPEGWLTRAFTLIPI